MGALDPFSIPTPPAAGDQRRSALSAGVAGLARNIALSPTEQAALAAREADNAEITPLERELTGQMFTSFMDHYVPDATPEQKAKLLRLWNGRVTRADARAAQGLMDKVRDWRKTQTTGAGRAPIADEVIYAKAYGQAVQEMAMRPGIDKLTDDEYQGQLDSAIAKNWLTMWSNAKKALPTDEQVAQALRGQPGAANVLTQQVLPTLRARLKATPAPAAAAAAPAAAPVAAAPAATPAPAGTKRFGF